MQILITGATGKVGQALIPRLLSDARWDSARICALCHNRDVEPHERISVVRGSIAERAVVNRAMEGVTHVVHLATCKEIPEDVMDVTVKGLFWLLEAARESATFRQFVLIGGDAAIGHFHNRLPMPATEAVPHQAYPGCYALSKVLEEVMVQQFTLQYGLNACCLRAPWIMEKDDFRYSLSFGKDVFGGPVWHELVGEAAAEGYRRRGAVPCLHDADGRPLKRNFVHVNDLVEAILSALDHPRSHGQLFNICMSRPVDYGEVAGYLAETRGLPSVRIDSRYHSNWMDNAKARALLEWEPQYDLHRLIEEAWSYERPNNDPRRVWYPG
ncbi:MAG: NAD-dependent epimerase/dehydratase family protein [Kiloniellaceae bacterium]